MSLSELQLFDEPEVGSMQDDAIFNYSHVFQLSSAATQSLLCT